MKDWLSVSLRSLTEKIKMKNKDNNDKLTRRDALLSCGRMAFAGLLAGLGSFLLFRKRNPAKGRQICISSGICSGCRVFDGCGLPQALSAKSNNETGPFK